MAEKKSNKKIIIPVVTILIIAAIVTGIILITGTDKKTDTKAEETTSLNSKSPESNEPATVSLTEEDKELFEITNELFFGYVFMDDYSYRAENALEMAYNMMICDEGPLYGEFFDESEITYGKSDPEGVFTEQGYICYPADNFDYMLENVFNITPNRQNPPTGYYYDGYYFACAPGGFGSGLWFENFEFEQIRDDKFKITVTVFDEYAESEEDAYFYSTYNAQLKEVDGKKMWSVHGFDFVDESVMR